MNNIILANNEIIFSEVQDNPTYLAAKFCVCDFTPNRNGVMLNRSTISNWIETLVDQPVVGKLGNTDSGDSDFTGHNANMVTRLGTDGEVYQDMQFDTSALGVFTSADIESINGKEYITATAKIWKRFPDFCSVIKKRLNNGVPINTSWEIIVGSSHKEFIGGKVVKVIDEGNFVGHCVLGSYIPPAYPDSGILEVASQENSNDNEIVDAIRRDINTSSVSNMTNEKEDEILDKNGVEGVVGSSAENNQTESSAGIEPTTETSAMTEFDLRQALREAISDKLNIEKWDFYILYHFPADGIVWTQLWNAESELDVITFTYTVENDVVTISEPTNAKLAVSVAQINDTVAELNAKIDTLNSSIVEASAKIQDANKQIAELTPFKDAADVAEQARIEAETASKRESLKVYASKSGLISDEEFSSDEAIKNCIESVDEVGIKAIIAERFVASLDKNENVVETSQVENVDSNEVEQAQARTNLTDTDDESGVDYKAVMSAFLKK